MEILLNWALPLFLTFGFAYLCGSIPFGFLIGKLNGIDIRTVGSCNIGATNVTRTLGKRWGVPCFVLDALKGAFPVAVFSALTVTPGSPAEAVLPYEFVTAAIAVVLGHMFPIWLRFKGGKGVSTIIGALLVLSPLSVFAGLLVWVLFYYTFHYVSLASIMFAIAMPVAQHILPLFIKSSCVTPPSAPIAILFILLSLFTIIKHRSNIQRLLNGTELRADSASARPVVKPNPTSESEGKHES